MALIAIILSLIAERFLGSMEELRRLRWFQRYCGWLMPRLSRYRYLDGAAGLVLLLLLPVGVVALLDYQFTQWWVVLALLFAVVLLLLSFGPSDLEAEVEAYLDARERGDEESARWHAGELLGGELPEQEAELTHRVIECTLVQANERLLAVLFWFLLLGPAGALLYRLSSHLWRHADESGGTALNEALMRLHAILDWPPARVCALAFALAGSFTEALKAWGEQHQRWDRNTRAVLVASGLGALGYHQGDESSPGESDSGMVRETLDLVRRAVLVLLSIVALFTLAGWMA